MGRLLGGCWEATRADLVQFVSFEDAEPVLPEQILRCDYVAVHVGMVHDPKHLSAIAGGDSDRQQNRP